MTYDMLDGGFRNLPPSAGVTRSSGFHVRNSGFLPYIWENPNDTSIASPGQYGNFASALPNYRWDAVTLQPYKGWPNGSTLGGDVAAIRNFVDLARENPQNAATRFFVYAAWANITLVQADLTRYESMWLRPSSSDASQPTILARSYFTNLTAALDGAGLDLNVIPVGEAFFDLDRQMRAGEVPGFDGIAALYRDDYHLNDLGKHLATAVTYATIYGQTPVGLAYGGKVAVSSATLRLMQESVWETVNTTPNTGVPEPGGAVLIVGAGVALLGRRTRMTRARQPLK